MDHKGHFTLGHNGFPEFFEEQLPISAAASASGVVGQELPARMLCLGFHVLSFDGVPALLGETPSPDSKPRPKR